MFGERPCSTTCQWRRFACRAPFFFVPFAAEASTIALERLRRPEFGEMQVYGPRGGSAPLFAECGAPEPACAIAAIRRQDRRRLALHLLASEPEFS